MKSIGFRIKGFCSTAILAFAFCLSLYAQTTETIVRKLRNGNEIHQRKLETVILVAPDDNPYLIDNTDSQNQEFTVRKLEIFTRNTVSKQEEVVWTREYKFPNNQRAFHRFEILDVFEKRGRYYVLYFQGLSLRVATAFKDAGAWLTENDAYLESTSESINPITEAKFVGKNLTISAKKGFNDGLITLYEWKFRGGKWILTKEKEQNIAPSFLYKKT